MSLHFARRSARGGRSLTVLALVPARAAPGGMPASSLALLGGKPLVAWAVESGLGARSVDRVIVSTGSREIAAIAEKHGAEVPFLLPVELNADGVSDLPLVVHALAELRALEGYAPDAVVLLHPTSPLRPAGLVDRCVERLAALAADSVRSARPRSVRPLGRAEPGWMLQRKEDGFAAPFVPGRSLDAHARPELQPLFVHDGCCDVVRTTHLPRECPRDEPASGLYGERRAIVLNDAPWSLELDVSADLEPAGQMAERLS